MDENKILITDDKGNEHEFNILFTFDANNKNYVICYEEGNEDEVYPFSYDEDNNIYLIEDEKELKMINEVLDSFDEVDEDEQSS